MRVFVLLVGLLVVTGVANAAPAKPISIVVTDHAMDGGESLDVTFDLSPSSTDPANKVIYYLIQRAGEYGGLYTDIAKVVPEQVDLERGSITFVVDKCERGEPYFFRIKAVAAGGVESDFIESTDAVRPSRQWFAGNRFWMGAITLMICGSVVFYILQARGGRDLKVRKIAGLEAVEEAVGRATEMGRSCMFIPGIQDINDMQTIAGLTILSRVSQQAAEYGAKMEVPTSKSLVMTAARETVAAAFLAAGRPDEYNEDNIYYVTDEQFGYVAYLSGMMVREKPAACFYMGSFFAESLILAETGNSIGSIQVAGTAQPAQLPFFVAACDYTLIGEEFFAASAYLSGDPDQLGSLKGQDVGKLIVAVLMIIGCVATTLADLTDADGIRAIADYLKNTILQSSS